jgi:hypothetical protein
MHAFDVTVPPGRQLAGVTAGGEAVVVYPGEYLVHVLRDKAFPRRVAVLRFVGADALGRDVHVAVDPALAGIDGLEPQALVQRLSVVTPVA